MHDEAATLPINIYVQMPSCVPSAPGLETPGATITPDDVAEAMRWPGIIGLGEMMNFPGVFNNDDKMHAEMAATMQANKTIGGHYAALDLGLPFHGYVAGGPADDHEGTRLEDGIARVRQGMRAMLRLGSAWYDVATQVKAITELGLDSRNFILCTDDSHSGTLVHEGHMNRVVRHAIAQGLPPVTAIQMATLNTAQHFGLEREIGSIAPGRRADIVLTSDLVTLPIEMVIARGQVLAENGRLTTNLPPYTYPDFARNTVTLGRSRTADDFRVVAPPDASDVVARVIGVVENQAPTQALTRTLSVTHGEVPADMEQDVAYIALVERHQGTGGVVNGFVTGFGYNVPCAVASTVAHDSHHLIVVGTSRADMAQAVNRLGEVGGGVVVIRDGTELALVELPIAGLMSDERAELVAEKASRLVEAMAACGCHLNNAYMQHSLLALVVIPALRISDQGLIDVTQFAPVPLFYGRWGVNKWGDSQNRVTKVEIKEKDTTMFDANMMAAVGAGLRQATEVFLIDRANGRILLGEKKSGLGEGKVLGIGGKADPGETMETTAVREAAEEIFVEIDPADLQKMGEISFLFPHKPAWNMHVHFYAVERWQGTPGESDEIKPVWFPLFELPLEAMWDDTRHWLPALLAEHYTPTGERNLNPTQLQGLFHYNADNSTVEKVHLVQRNGLSSSQVPWQIEPWTAEHPSWSHLNGLIDALEQTDWVAFNADWHLSSHMLVAHEAGQPVGFLRYVLQHIGPEVDEPPVVLEGESLVEAKVIAFGVDPSQRRRGIGHQLQLRLIADCLGYNCFQIRSHSSRSNQANHQLKLGLGFAVHPLITTDRRDGAYFLLPLRR